ncbi:asparaginase [bacterium]|nr:asparaginase [bacterium]
MNKEPKYAELLKHRRNGLVEQVHFGIIMHIGQNGIISKIGEDNNYKFYHRSCMKPLQVSPIIDLELDKKYNLTSEEIAVCCASHTGDIIHQNLVKSVLNKAGFSEKDLLCLPHQPLSIEEQQRLILNNEQPNRLHNNCSGKHSAMLMIAKELGFPISNYNAFENPLTDYILEHVCKLCEVSKKDIVISKDGCGLPVIATKLEDLGKGFLNLFCSEKYLRIRDAFLNNPYLIGGKNRQDSEIINATDNIVAKVGACGLCVVVNINKKECIVVKIADSNIEARAIVTNETLLQLKWSDPVKFSDQMNNIYSKDIITQDKVVLGDIFSCFNIN